MFIIPINGLIMKFSCTPSLTGNSYIQSNANITALSITKCDVGGLRIRSIQSVNRRPAANPPARRICGVVNIPRANARKQM